LSLRAPGLYFILPFIFSTVYNNYKTILEQTEQYYVLRRKKALLSAFNQLDRGKSLLPLADPASASRLTGNR
jgi:hypothetical protein